MSLGNNIKRIRQAKGFSISELSSITGASRSTITDIENDNGRSPNTATLKKLADALRVSIDDFFKEDSVETIETDAKDALPEGYLRVSKKAAERGISPEDIDMAIDFLIKARQKDEKAKRELGK